MHILMYFAVVSSALIALLFVTDATLEKGAQPIVTTQRVGLPESHLPNSTQILTSNPAPAPDMASPLVLVAAPKVQAAPDFLSGEPAARTARAEAPSQNNRVTDREPRAEFRQNRDSPRNFGLSGMWQLLDPRTGAPPVPRAFSWLASDVRFQGMMTSRHQAEIVRE